MTTYTEEQLQIELLKQKNDGFFNAITDIKIELREIRSDMRSNLHLTIALIMGIYAIIGAPALAKLFGVHI